MGFSFLQNRLSFPSIEKIMGNAKAGTQFESPGLGCILVAVVRLGMGNRTMPPLLLSPEEKSIAFNGKISRMGKAKI
jgi:hypothetical protein